MSIDFQHTGKIKSQLTDSPHPFALDRVNAMKEIELIKKLDYAFSDTKTNLNIGAYKFVLNDDAKKLLKEVKDYLREKSGQKECVHCSSHGKFGFSIPGTGEVGRHICPKCHGEGWVPVDMEVYPPEESEINSYHRTVIKNTLG